ncbi:MAG: alpha/beta hydrolase [Denitromonas halophila]|nr:MAG: alpha/beta hydrolase [Denitromonas halophila]
MEHFTADDGERLHLKISGEGSPLILLHGWTASHRDWNPFMADFEVHHRVVRWDARGHGGHPLRAATTPTVQRMAQDLAAVIDHYQLDGATVVGHSMGALTLWQYLRDFGHARLSRLVFIDQSPRLVTGPGWRCGIYGDFDAERNAAFMRDLRADFAEAVLRLVAHGHNAAARARYEENGEAMQSARRRLASVAAGPLIDCWASLTAADYRDVLKHIPLPTLLVYGGASNFYSTELAHYVRDSIPNALLHIYEEVDHAPHLWQRERFVNDVLRFVAEASGQ